MLSRMGGLTEDFLRLRNLAENLRCKLGDEDAVKLFCKGLVGKQLKPEPNLSSGV